MRLLDPICGKPINAADGTLHTEYKRRRYYFCSPRCKASFDREAERIRLHELMRVGALLSSGGKVRWGLA